MSSMLVIEVWSMLFGQCSESLLVGIRNNCFGFSLLFHLFSYQLNLSNFKQLLNLSEGSLNLFSLSRSLSH